MLALLAQLKNDNLISELSYQFAKLIDHQQLVFGYTETQKNLAVLLSALLSHHVAEGHSCLDLTSQYAQDPFNIAYRFPERHQQILQKIGNISPLVFADQLKNHIAFSHTPDQVAPLLFQGEKLYLYRYWQSENRIAKWIDNAVNSPSENDDPAFIQTILNRFPFDPTARPDWQKIAVATALKKPFCLISGGPGTGKTRTVAILLSALQLKQLEQNGKPLKIALVAPTGKAAARLKESIANSFCELNLPDELKQLVPNQAATIHRLIGIRPDSDEPKYHPKNPLHFDLLVVDEASMIDLFVMEKLLNALKPNTRIIMLGDKDQLASVEAGNLMAEFGRFLEWGYSPAHCDYLTQTSGYTESAKQQTVPAICDCLAHLKYSYRFGEHSGIGQLASEINAMQGERSWQKIANTQLNDLALIAYPPAQAFTEKNQWVQHCVQLVVEKAVECYRHYLQLVQQRQQNPQAVSLQAIFHAFQQVRFLSALRVSELGVEQLNQRIAEALLRKGLIHFRHSREHYLGKPILITENAPALHIFSGDIGIVLPDEQGKLRVYFDTELDGKPHQISLSRVPNNEPAYVMTVHKSQGSEFSHTLLVMPLHPSPVLSKELLYTAVTRAKHTFTLFSHETIWRQGVQNQNRRQSGLVEQLLAMSEK